MLVEKLKNKNRHKSFQCFKVTDIPKEQHCGYSLFEQLGTVLVWL